MQLIEADLSIVRECVVTIRLVDKRTDEYQRLVTSVKKRGILSPLLVRKIEYTNEPMFYSIIDGVARFYAAQDACLETVPTIVTAMTDLEVMEVQLIKSLHRFPVKRIEYAMALFRLICSYPDVTLPKFADRLDIAPEWVLKTLMIETKLDGKLLPSVYSGKICLQNAYVLAKLPKEEQVDFKKKSMTLAPCEFVPQVHNRVKELRAISRAN